MVALRRLAATLAVLLAAGTASAAPLTAGHSLTIVNDTGQAVEFIYVITPQGGWPEDLLGEDILLAGATYRFQSDQPACRYDVKVVFADGFAVERPDFDICAQPEIHLAALLAADAPPVESLNWDGGPGSSLSGDGGAMPAPPEPSYAISVEPGEVEPDAQMAVPAPIDRGVPICPGDVRCKKKKP